MLTAAAMDAVLQRIRPDLVLDLMLPGEDGLSIRRAAARDDNILILMLTAKSDEIDRVVGLEIGADDYLTKPFAPRELLARVRAILRRVKAAPAKLAVRRYAFDRFVIDLDLRSIQFGDASDDPASSPAWNSICSAAVLRPRRVLTRDQILMDPWTFGRTVRPHRRYADLAAAQAARYREPWIRPDHDGAQRQLSVHAIREAGVVMLRVTLATRLALIVIVALSAISITIIAVFYRTSVRENELARPSPGRLAAIAEMVERSDRACVACCLVAVSSPQSPVRVEAAGATPALGPASCEISKPGLDEIVFLRAPRP